MFSTRIMLLEQLKKKDQDGVDSSVYGYCLIFKDLSLYGRESLLVNRIFIRTLELEAFNVLR